ncbi:multicopper oxidase domain-containing protein [Candidatus Saccharibacteria bacterium]|nr:multicopper oxidase domain-containing protein [Candidatus Saccharibacteria bacterium]
MNKPTYRQRLTKSGIAIIALLVIMIGWREYSKSMTTNDHAKQRSDNYSNQLQVPPLLDYTKVDGIKLFNLNAQKSTYQFSADAISETYGYNGPILGPTIRATRGDKLDIAVTNNLDEQTTSHWHGAVVPGDADGGIHNIINPNETWHAKFTVSQPAATLWYHPHQHQETAKQVYNGLGGFLIIDDQDSSSLGLPTNYGVDDIPLVIQSKKLDQSGKLEPYQVSHMEQAQGLEGNTIMLNAQVKPYLNISTNLIRLRLLNGSNSDTYNVSLSSGQEFYVIGTDGGLLEQPVSVTTLELTTAKRYEILIDSSAITGDNPALMINNSAELLFTKKEQLTDKYTLPNSLIKFDELPNAEIDRDFDLGMLMGNQDSMMSGRMNFGINDQSFDSNRINFTVNADSLEYWRIYNDPSGMSTNHPFHIHATQFQIISINQEKPPDLLRGWHNTIDLKPGDEVVLAVPFAENLSGTYMYHCHILEHEDAGMMGQFQIQ